MDRRKFSLGGLCSIALPSLVAFADDAGRLQSIARNRGLVYGAAVQSQHLRSDSHYSRLIATHCGIITPEWEMKWGAIEADRGQREYSQANWLVNFAEDHGMSVRGHAAVWQTNLPDWAKRALPGPDGATLLAAHVEDIVAHYAGRLRHWDVVNEALFPANGVPGGFGRNLLFESFGREYIRDAFYVARAADPHAILYYNDENFFYDDGDSAARRRDCLNLIDWLLRDGAPIQGLGIESHLVAKGPRFDQAVYANFLQEVADRGLEIMVTELDVNDKHCGRDMEVRDVAVADHAKDYLEVALDQRAVKGVVTWGISDRYTWLNGSHRWARSDGSPNRCLPFDEHLNPKPLFDVLVQAFEHAPVR